MPRAGRIDREAGSLAVEPWVAVNGEAQVDLALRMGAPFLVERGIDPSEEGLGPALIMRLLLGLPEESAKKALRRIPWQAARHLCLYVFSVDDRGNVTEYSPRDFKNYQNKLTK